MTLVHMERVFATLSYILDKVLPECIFAKGFMNPEHSYPNFINMVKFPYITARLVVFTEYTLLNFQGNPKQHLMISSGRGNEHLYNEEICGAENLKKSIQVVTDLTYFLVEELPDKRLRVIYC